MSTSVDNDCGFTWGNLEVTRMTHREGKGRTLSVRVAGKPYADGLQIYVSEGGRSIRVWKQGQELE